jgi:hypothetical protein
MANIPPNVMINPENKTHFTAHSFPPIAISSPPNMNIRAISPHARILKGRR